MDVDEKLDQQERAEAAEKRVAEMFTPRKGSSREWIGGAKELLRPGARAMLFGPKGSGKSWAALELCVEVVEAGGTAVYIDVENGRARMDERVGHLLAGRSQGVRDWMADDSRWMYTDNFTFRDLHDDAVMNSFRLWMSEVDLWVIDSAARVLSQLGLDETSNAQFAKFMGKFVDPVAGEWAAVLILDNVGYDESHPRGASNKTDLVELAYKVEGGKTCTPTKHGKITLKKRRDRDGDAAEELSIGIGAGKYTALAPVTPDTKKAALHDLVVELLTDREPVASKADVEKLLRDAEVTVPRRTTFNAWMDDWHEEEGSPISKEPGGWQVI